ncbi:MAG TPA: roadblock/LC7 domain-containing protein [Thermoplasmata archaeon]|nr:roadblock/LC7 domain-containing protein [Thermoplasmata archaeon]
MGDVWTDLEEVIASLSSVSDIQAVAIVRRDGLVITHNLPSAVEPKIVAAMTAAIVGTSEMATVQLGQGKFTQALIDGEHGKLVSTGAGDEALLVALAYRDANLGLILMALERAAHQIDQILSRTVSAR